MIFQVFIMFFLLLANTLHASTAKNTLVLYDTSSNFGWMGEVYALQAANLVSHFGERTTLPISDYKENLTESYDAVMYLGSVYGEKIPDSFLADIFASLRLVRCK